MDSELVVLYFESKDAAELGLATLRSLEAEGYIDIDQCAVLGRDSEGWVTAKNADKHEVSRAAGFGGVLGLVVGGVVVVVVGGGVIALAAALFLFLLLFFCMPYDKSNYESVSFQPHPFPEGQGADPHANRVASSQSEIVPRNPDVNFAVARQVSDTLRSECH